MTTQAKWVTSVRLFLSQHRIKAVCLFFSIIVVALFSSIVQAEVVRKIVSAVININQRTLLRVLVWLICVTTASAMFKVLTAKWMFFFKKGLRIMLEDQGIDALHQTEGSPTLKHDEVMSILQNSVERVVNNFSKTMHDSVVTLTQIIAAVIYSIRFSWEMVLLCFVISGLMLFLSNKNNQQIPVKIKKVGESFNQIYSLIWDHLHNAEATSFLNQNRVFTHLDKTIIENSNYQIDASKVQNASRVFSRFANMALVMLTALYGGFMALNYGMNMANILALIIILQILADAIFRVPTLFADFKGVQGDGQVLDKLYTLVSSHPENPASVDVIQPPKQIHAQSIRFCYSTETLASSSVAFFSIQQGEILTVAGVSGSGKTTLLNMCAGLLTPDEGDLYWDQTNITTIHRKSAWAHLTLLEQTSVYLPTTLKNNIILADQNYHHEGLTQAIIDAGLTHFVGQLPLGLETELTRNKLSSGELQKICIARAFYQNKPILLLDEATSALDPSSESHILEALKRRAHANGLMVIAVTHRLNFLSGSDHVLFLQKGASSVYGKHEELLVTCKAYGEMIREEKRK